MSSPKSWCPLCLQQLLGVGLEADVLPKAKEWIGVRGGMWTALPVLCLPASPAVCEKRTNRTFNSPGLCTRPGLPGNYQMLLWLCREARILREGLLIAFWPWGAVLDKLLYNDCTVQPAEQHCNIFLLSSCSFGSSYLISFIHVNVFKNAAASACRMFLLFPLFMDLGCSSASSLPSCKETHSAWSKSIFTT